MFEDAQRGEFKGVFAAGAAATGMAGVLVGPTTIVTARAAENGTAATATALAADLVVAPGDELRTTYATAGKQMIGGVVAGHTLRTAEGDVPLAELHGRTVIVKPSGVRWHAECHERGRVTWDGEVWVCAECGMCGATEVSAVSRKP